MLQELHAEQLTQTFDPAVFEFETTATLEPLTGIIGQPRAVAALEFGLGIQEIWTDREKNTILAA